MWSSIRPACNVDGVIENPTDDVEDPTTDVYRIVANLLMSIFVVSTSVGAALLWSLGAGFLCLGLTSAVVGYLLGAE